MLFRSDPHVPEIVVVGRHYKCVDLSKERMLGSDLAVIITDHSAVDAQRLVDGCQRVFDTRNATRNVKSGREKVRKL